MKVYVCHMQITIDTQKDSKEAIRKAVAFLSSLADGHNHNSNIFGSDSSGIVNESSETEPSSGTNAFASMFGNSEPKTEDVSVLQTDEKKEETNDDSVEILEY